ncbi:MAG: DMT family transporter, partial [Anaerolineae bacterium]|nr:DMT family transporter [Anaerolineae bacterium]
WLARTQQLGVARELLRRRTFIVAWIALTGITLFYFLENLALEYTTATNAGVLANLTSVFMVLIGAVWLHERLNGVEWGALALAFAGAMLVSRGAGHLTLESAGLRGDVLMVVATLFAAIYSIGAKRLVVNYQPVVVTAVVATLGALFLFPLTLWEVGGLTGLPSLLALPPIAWLALLLLGLGAGALANIWWMRILGSATAARASMTLFLIPVISTTLAVVVLGETLTVMALIGAALVLVGVALVERDRAQIAKRPAPDTTIEA